MHKLLGENEQILKSKKQNVKVKDIIGDIKDGQSLFMLTSMNDNAAFIIFDGKDEDFDRKYKFLMRLKELMNCNNNKIQIQQFVSVINENEEFNIMNKSCDQFYCNYLRFEEKGIDNQILKDLRQNNEDTLHKLKNNSISEIYMDGIKLIQYLNKKIKIPTYQIFYMDYLNQIKMKWKD